MKAFSARYPIPFALTVTLAGMLSLLWPFSVSQWSLTAQVLIGRITICLLAVGLLTRLGWWHEAGFGRPARWQIVIPYLPLLLPVLLNVMGLLGSGTRVSGWEMLLLGLVTYGLGGFFEEAIFRGLVLRALWPGGLMRAAVLTAVIFGAVHAVNLLLGANAMSTVFQIVNATLIGFAFVGPLAYTRNIWPLVFIHSLSNFVAYLMAGGFLNTAATSSAPSSAEWAGALIFFLPLAIYSFWLMRRAGRDAYQVQRTAALQQA